MTAIAQRLGRENQKQTVVRVLLGTAEGYSYIHAVCMYTSLACAA